MQQPYGWPQRPYPTVPAPAAMHHASRHPIPAPGVMQQALGRPLRGLWIDHVPDGARIAAVHLQCTTDRQAAWRSPLATGDWASFRYVWMGGHPEHMTPQMVMPDSWFDHEAARTPPPPMAFDPAYEPAPGNTVAGVVSSSMSGSGTRDQARRIPDRWRAGLLRTAAERIAANELLRNASRGDEALWYRIVLDEGWTMRRAAEVLREAGICVGELCSWTNRWAQRPPGTPPPESAPAEEPWAVWGRCHGQIDEGGPWPLSRTGEIGEARRWQRVA